MGNLETAIVLGIVEGVTEYLPVSSTGHLIIVGHLLGFVGDKASRFEVAIQSGAILAVVLLYWKRFVGLLPFSHGAAGGAVSALSGWGGLWRIALATFPTLLVGFLGRHWIQENLFTPRVVTSALVAGGVAILIVERCAGKKAAGSLDALTSAQALGIGLFQVLALWPGTSRAAATILGGMLLGLNRKGAAEFSFLIAVPVLTAATGYQLLRMHDDASAGELMQFAVGFLVSFLSAALAVKTFVSFLSRWSLVPFAWYRLLVAPVFHWLTRGASL
ncbi:MAG TPA: undecaprenyl-diphosphate phosphatase [candidate division Zixibacteria bacterium]|nr:undecaprenyl-diphosphate phosphatase [candidate division Zixibacteria bacterium]